MTKKSNKIIFIIFIIVAVFFLARGLGYIQSGVQLDPNKAFLCQDLSYSCVQKNSEQEIRKTEIEDAGFFGTATDNSAWLTCGSDRQDWTGQCKYFIENTDGTNHMLRAVRIFACKNEFNVGDGSVKPYTSTLGILRAKDGCLEKQVPISSGGTISKDVPIHDTTDLLGRDGIIDFSNKYTHIYVENTDNGASRKDIYLREVGKIYQLERVSGTGTKAFFPSCDLRDLSNYGKSEGIFPKQDIPSQPNFESIVPVGIAYNYCDYLNEIELDLANNVIIDSVTRKKIYIKEEGYAIPLKIVEWNGRDIQIFDESARYRADYIDCLPAETARCNPDATIKKDEEISLGGGASCSFLNPVPTGFIPTSSTEVCQFKCVDGQKVKDGCETIKENECASLGLGYTLANNECFEVGQQNEGATLCTEKVSFLGLSVPNMTCKLDSNLNLSKFIAILFGIIAFFLTLLAVYYLFGALSLFLPVIAWVIIGIIALFNGIMTYIFIKTFFWEILFIMLIVGVVTLIVSQFSGKKGKRRR